MGLENDPQRRFMPDVAAEKQHSFESTIDWVGMQGVEIPAQIQVAGGKHYTVPARADIFVSLDDPQARGIHMSRLFLALDERLQGEEMGLPLLQKIARDFLKSHSECSRSSKIEVSFDYLTQRPALLSSNKGWRHYPTKLHYEITPEGERMGMELRVAYSSTCPCSAALSRQLLQEKFDKDFSGNSSVEAEKIKQWLGLESSVVGTPHSQRSYAQVEMGFDDLESVPTILEGIDSIEGSLKTPVQAAVKREDEQEFARINAQNLMFCEDSARRIKALLDAQPVVKRYNIEVSHEESLHPHNAVSRLSKP